MSAESQYYDYDSWLRGQHNESEDDICECAECREEAEQNAADLAYDSWKEDRALGY